MRVLFLDIDGVVCTLRSHLAFGQGILMQKWDPVVCGLLVRLCRKYRLKIVVSSVWRKTPGKCRRYLKRHGLFRYLHRDWRTPSIHLSSHRGGEIEAWLKRNPKVTDYLIIDDDRDMLEEQMPRLIYIEQACDGLSFSDYKKIDKHFSPEKEA